METFDLIEKYAKSKLNGYDELSINDYDINGSIIKIRYSYTYDWSTDKTDRSYDNYLQVDLLDYITFVFNSK